MYLNEKNIIQKKTRNIFNSFKKEDELDESTFDLWKTGLQKELPDFWEKIHD
jgi:hypothetical protein